MRASEPLIEWLKNEMRKRDFSQADLSRAMGKTEATLSRILNGVSAQVSADTTAALSEWAGITEYQLLSISKGEGVGSTAPGAVGGIPGGVSPRLQSLFDRLNALAPEEQKRIIDGLDLLYPS